MNASTTSKENFPARSDSLVSFTGSICSTCTPTTNSNGSKMGRKQKGKRRRQMEKEITTASVTGSCRSEEDETSVEMPETDSTQLTLSPPPPSFVPRRSKIPVLSANARLSGQPFPNYSDTRIPRLSPSMCTSLTCSPNSENTPKSATGSSTTTGTYDNIPGLRSVHEDSYYEVPRIKDKKMKTELPVNIIAAVEDMQIEIAFGASINDEDVLLTATVPGEPRSRA